MSSLWSKFNEPELARFVTREVGRSLSLPDRARPCIGVPARRRELVGAIYQAFATAGIRYAPERYHPEATHQEIRSRSEVFDDPRLGTCLDLAVHFCGACVDFELLPILIVLDGHALMAVSLRHGRREWSDYGRAELTDFWDGPLHDPARLRQLVDSGDYIAVECTGVAVADELPGAVPEGKGRQRGLLGFDRAVEAGREQLDVTERSLRFALDIAVAHDRWGMTPARLSSLEELAFTHVIEDLVPTAGMVARRVEERREVVRLAPPIAPRLPPEPPLIDRHDEVEVGVGAAAGAPVAFHGPVGSGRTSVLHAVARDQRLAAADGVAVVAGRGLGVRDLLQEVFDSFFDDPAGAQRSRAWLGRHLTELRAVVVIDDSALADDELSDVLSALPSCAVLVATERAPALTAGHAHELAGLRPVDAVSLLSRVVGRDLTVEETAAAETLCERLGGHPGRLVLVGTRVRDEGADLPALTATVQEPADVGAGVYAQLPAEAKAIVQMLLALVGGRVSHDQLVAIAGPGADEAVRDLLGRQLISAASPRYILDPTLADDLGGRVHPTAAATIVDHYRALSALHRRRPDVLLDDVDVLVDVARLAAAYGRHDAVVDIARSSDIVLAKTGRLDALRVLASLTRDSARMLGDEAAVAWALHQAGSLDLGLEDYTSARELLEEALAMRRRLGDLDAVRATSTNLDVLRALAPEVFDDVHDGDAEGEVTERIPTVERDREERHEEFAQVAATPHRRWPWIVLAIVVGGALLAWLGWRATSASDGEVSVAPTRLDFGPAVVDGGEPTLRSITLENASRADLGLVKTIAGAHPDDFRITEDACGPQLEAGAACTIALAFAPTARGDRTALLTITSTGEEARDMVVPLAGTGATAAEALPRIEPAPVDFGDVPVGTTVEREAVLGNDGEAAARVRGVTTGGAFEVVEDGCTGRELGTDDGCRLLLAVTPEATGPLESLLVIEFEGDLDDLTTALVAVGTAPEIAVDPDTLVLATSRVPTGVVGVTNTGTAPLTIEGIRLDGDPAVFDLITDCLDAGPGPLEPGARCRIDVTYRGYEPEQSATIVILSDDPGGDASVALEGVPGVAPQVASPDPEDRDDNPYSVRDDGTWVIPVVFDRPIAEDSVAANANIRVTDLQENPIPVDVTVVGPTEIEVATQVAPEDGYVYLLIDGDGDAPVSGEDGVPLDGDADGEPGGNYRRELGPVID